MFEIADNRWMPRDAVIAFVLSLAAGCAVGFYYDTAAGVFAFIACTLVVLFIAAQIRLRRKNNISLWTLRPSRAPMRIEAVEDAPEFDFLPVVTWWQKLPIEIKSEAWGCLIVLGLVLLVLAIFSPNVRQVVTVLATLLVAGFILDFFKVRFLKLVTRGRWREKPTLKTLRASALLFRSGDSYTFNWSYNTVDETREGGSVPLDSFKSFEITTSEEWFTALHEAKPEVPYFIIMINTLDGPQKVAAHAGTRAEMAELHSVLTRLFVTNRPNLPKPLPQSSQRPSGPDDRSDLPTKL